jgi:iron complex outermembrane receptor protein
VRKIKNIMHLVFWCMFCYASNLNAQTSTIVGSITNENKPNSNIPVTLLNIADSSLTRFGLIDSTNAFQFNRVPLGKYRIAITALGWKPFYSKIFTIGDSLKYTIPPFTLSPSDYTNLAAVTVTGRKAFIEQKPGQMTINIDAAPTNAGTSVMEVLVKSPGISVDQNGTISLNGKRGVLVMLDGKPAYLNGQELEAYLKGLPSLTIDKIEIMTNPPAKYDASGGAGAINIITKKLTKTGFNSTVTLNYSQGVYAKSSAGLNINYYTGKFNFFLNGSSEYGTDFLRIPGPQYFYDQNGKITSILDGTTASKAKNTNPAFNVKTGMDYYLSPKTTIGVVLSANMNNTEKFGHSTITAQDFTSSQNSIIRQKNYSTREFTSAAVNLNFAHKLNDKGGLLTVDLDYLKYTPKQTLLFNTQTFNENQTLENKLEQKGSLPFRVDIYSAKMDYSQSLRNDFTLNLGLKSSYVTNDNVASYFLLDSTDNKWVPNPLMSRRFIYKENINAAYAMLKKTYGSLEIQGGLRAEYTDYRGNLKKINDAIPTKQDSSFANSYLSLFPSLNISYSINKKNTLSLNYGRKVDRPNYYDLNPFVYYITPYTSLTGNADLKPQYTNNIELYYSYQSWLSTTVSYSNTKNAFENISYLTGQNTVIKPGNIGEVQSFSLSVNYRKSINSWWTPNLFIQTTYNNLNGSVRNEKIHVTSTQFSSNMSNLFQFPGGWSGELSGYYKSRVKYLQGVYSPIWSVGAAISKKLLKDRITAKAGVSDIFYSQIISGIDYLPRSISYYTFYADSRRLTLSISYKFGKKTDIPDKVKSVSEADRVK